MKTYSIGGIVKLKDIGLSPFNLDWVSSTTDTDEFEFGGALLTKEEALHELSCYVRDSKKEGLQNLIDVVDALRKYTEVRYIKFSRG